VREAWRVEDLPQASQLLPPDLFGTSEGSIQLGLKQLLKLTEAIAHEVQHHALIGRNGTFDCTATSVSSTFFAQQRPGARFIESNVHTWIGIVGGELAEWTFFGEPNGRIFHDRCCGFDATGRYGKSFPCAAGS